MNGLADRNPTRGGGGEGEGKGRGGSRGPQQFQLGGREFVLSTHGGEGTRHRGHDDGTSRAPNRVGQCAVFHLRSSCAGILDPVGHEWSQRGCIGLMSGSRAVRVPPGRTEDASLRLPSGDGRPPPEPPPGRAIGSADAVAAGARAFGIRGRSCHVGAGIDPQARCIKISPRVEGLLGHPRRWDPVHTCSTSTHQPGSYTIPCWSSWSSNQYK